ncbi:hypothetical protein CLHOM_13790 [Clostridium homopropionicum DSM 5847]|uniref:Uncharacterized protein n=1 Tax=Clostridium homopropionicum DSM 5847 TaxID=1121318 RepID=A0A0L6ZB46_9CLOT|nr:DUF4912 domain-containing protein [Clostridium homopropionicum]KOA20180.1 hypothetical protein CLHOM_13790 [Clostridium homopropionicum DSM 5847]SFG60120.1 protein of unknown function [Clostridium homopropionicum]
MYDDGNSSVSLLVQGSYTIYCYFNISSKDVYKIKELYGEESWKKSKSMIIVYEFTNEKEIKIYEEHIDPFADNWFITLNRCNIQVLVKLCRKFENGTILPIATSNKVTTLTNKESSNNKVKFIKVCEFVQDKIYSY